MRRSNKDSLVRRSVQLKPADPFELIRWLARTQSDPRKAVAELVQNSFDAQSSNVVVSRATHKGAATLVVRDDGEGVLPDMEREQALHYLATHIGHSRKMGLDPAERMQRVVAGKYGVGLLGFWSIGRTLELRTRVAGSPVWALRLEEDSARADIVRLPVRTDSPETFTEAAVFDVHPAAQRLLGGRRLTDYLADELRGQLLARPVQLVVNDGVARGLAQKRFVVAPRRFGGERLDLPSEIDTGDHTPPVRVELYLARGTERAAIQVACAGTLVAEDLADLAALGVDGPPWIGCELVGILDFAGFNVPPGTRRGVVPDLMAAAFVRALDELCPLVIAELDRLERERRVAVEQDVLRDLRRALRGFRRRLPHYDLPRVEGRDLPVAAASGAALPAPEPEREPEPETDSAAAGETAAAHLFPPGPLASVRITPGAPTITPGGARRLRASALDADGRAVDGARYAWRVEAGGSGLSLAVDDGVSDGARAHLVAPPLARSGAEARVAVEAHQGGSSAVAEVIARVVEDEGDAATAGIPEPHFVSDADGRWRSRMSGERWEVNAEHEDYVALRGDGRGRIRYLLSLLAKEIVVRTSGRTDAAGVLESLVEVLAHAERNLRGA